MPHLLWVMCLVTSSFFLGQAPSVPASQQSEPQPTPQTGEPTALTIQAPRQPLPPDPNATAQELERGGDELRVQKLFAEAVDYYRAAARKSNSAVLHNKLGIAHLQMLQFKEAQKEFERAIKMDRKYAEAINNHGVVFYMRKKYGKAIGEYEKAIKLNDTSASFHSNLGMACFDHKEYERAGAEFMRALELDPNIFERQSQGGVAARMASPEDRARYAYTLARIYARQGIYDRSLEYLRKAIEEGYSHVKDAYNDDVFAGLRKDPRFTEVMAKTQPLPN